MGFLLTQVWASPLDRRLARRYGRNEFVILRMALSPPVAPHLASRRRSYIRLQAGVGLPGEDLHLPVRLRLQAHDPRLREDERSVGHSSPDSLVSLRLVRPRPR